MKNQTQGNKAAAVELPHADATREQGISTSEDPGAPEGLGGAAVGDPVEGDEEQVRVLGAHASDRHLHRGVDAGADKQAGARLEPFGVVRQGPDDDLPSDAVGPLDLPDEDGLRRPFLRSCSSTRRRLSRRSRRGRCGPPWLRRP